LGTAGCFGLHLEFLDMRFMAHSGILAGTSMIERWTMPALLGTGVLHLGLRYAPTLRIWTIPAPVLVVEDDRVIADANVAVASTN
jgi:hypothetical protein